MIFLIKRRHAYDGDLWNVIAEERQQNNIELIASENVVLRQWWLPRWSILTNMPKADPGRRYYGGTDVVDVSKSRDRTG